MKKTKSSLPPKGGPTKEDRKIKEYCDKFTTDIPKTKEEFIHQCRIIENSLRMAIEEFYEKILLTRMLSGVVNPVCELYKCKEEAELKKIFCKAIDAESRAFALMAEFEESL